MGDGLILFLGIIGGSLTPWLRRWLVAGLTAIPTPEQAGIAGSTNYFIVVCFHSVVVFVSMFAAWAWMLSCWEFSPLTVLLLLGVTGSITEASINPTSLIGGFWVLARVDVVSASLYGAGGPRC